MKWALKLINKFKYWIKLSKRKSMAKLVLDDYGDKSIEVDLMDLIYAGYDENNDCIVLSVANKPPVYLPVTNGNMEFLKMISPYFRQKATNDPKVALINIGNKPKT